MKEIRWLHISDIHFKLSNYDTKNVRRSFLETIKEKGIGYYKYLFISGDLLYKYEDEGNYEKSRLFIEELLKISGIEKRNVFIVPGNHDLKRDSDTDYEIEGIVIKEENISERIDRLPNKRYRLLLERQRSFIDFYNTFLGRKYDEERLHNFYEREDLNVLEINSCLIAQSNDFGKLSVYLSKLLESCSNISSNKEKLSIAILHHELEYLNSYEKEEVKKILIDNNFDLILCGHTHKNRFDQYIVGKKIIRKICSAALAEDDSNYSDINFIEGRYNGNNIKIIYYKWFNNLSQWKHDVSIDRSADETGTLTIELDKDINNTEGYKEDNNSTVNVEEVIVNERNCEVNIRKKIRVFISSRNDTDKYKSIRYKLKKELEDTGLVDVYIFEDSIATTLTMDDNYLSELEDSHLIIFLLDNEKDLIDPDIMKQWRFARQINKKSIYIFYNNDEKEISSIQKEIMKYKEQGYQVVSNFEDFELVGYKSIVEDILKIYREYCNGRIELKERDISVNESKELSIETEDVRKDENINESILSSFEGTKILFKRLNKYYSVDEDKIDFNETDKLFMYFSNVILCNTCFEDDKIESLIEHILKIHNNKDIEETIIMRWNSIKALYKNDIKGAIEWLKKAYDYSQSNDLSKWIQDDILIDQNNLENILMNNENIFYESEAQKKLNKNNRMLCYPILDRIAHNIDEGILNEEIKRLSDSPYTTSIGTGINLILDNVAKYFIISVLYGSWTHIRITVSFLKKIFDRFGDIYEVNEWQFSGLRYSIISYDSKMMKRIKERNSGVISSCSFEKIDNLYNQIEYLPEGLYKNYVRLQVFSLLGNYFSDKVYSKMENEFFIILNKWIYGEKTQVSWESEVFNAINSNIRRINVNKLTRILIDMLKMNYFRFWDNIFKSLRLIDFNKVNSEYRDELFEFLIDLIKDENNREKYMNLKYLLINIRLSSIIEADKLDDTIKNCWEEFFKEEYKLISNEKEEYYDEYISNRINDLETRNKQQGLGGGYRFYGHYPLDSICHLVEHADYEINKTTIQRLIYVIDACLKNRKQLYGEKVSCIRFLIFLRDKLKSSMFNNIVDEYCSQILYEDIRDGRGDNFLDKYNEVSLENNYTLLKLALNKSIMKELLECISCINTRESIDLLHWIQSIDNYFKYTEGKLENKEYELILLYELIKNTSNKEYEIRVAVVDALFTLYERSNNELALNTIVSMVDDMDYRIKFTILKRIRNSLASKFKDILDRLKVDNNYVIRHWALELIEDIEFLS